MVQRRILYEVIALIVIIFIAFLLVSRTAPDNSAAVASRACFENSKCIELELAVSEQEMQEGLSYRDSLPQNTGMLFVFDSVKEHFFWMKDMLFSIDILWLDSEGTIIAFKENAPPCNVESCPVYSTGLPSKYGLEVNSGFVSSNGLELGQKIVFENLSN